MSKKKEPLNGMASLYQIRQLAEKNQAPDDESFRAQYPVLFSILSDNRISDDQLIDPPVLSVRNSAGDWQLSLSVPGLRMYGDLLAPNLVDGLAALELMLASGRFNWKVNTKKRVVSRPVEKPKKS